MVFHIYRGNKWGSNSIYTEFFELNREKCNAVAFQREKVEEAVAACGAGNLPEAGQAEAATGRQPAGLPRQKWEAEVEGWGSSWVGSRGALDSITGSTDSGISEEGSAAGLRVELSVSGD